VKGAHSGHNGEPVFRCNENGTDRGSGLPYAAMTAGQWTVVIQATKLQLSLERVFTIVLGKSVTVGVAVRYRPFRAGQCVHAEPGLQTITTGQIAVTTTPAPKSIRLGSDI
jgi:hypothetical protein